MAGMIGLLSLTTLEVAMLWLSLSIPASWFIPRSSLFYSWLFPIFPLSIDPSILIAGRAGGHTHISGAGGINFGAMLQGWMMRGRTHMQHNGLLSVSLKGGSVNGSSGDAGAHVYVGKKSRANESFQIDDDHSILRDVEYRNSGAAESR